MYIQLSLIIEAIGISLPRFQTPTKIYLDANLALKEEILAKAQPIHGKPGRYRPTDRLLRLLSSL
jgi:hypothetical protein